MLAKMRIKRLIELEGSRTEADMVRVKREANEIGTNAKRNWEKRTGSDVLPEHHLEADDCELVSRDNNGQNERVSAALLGCVASRR